MTPPRLHPALIATTGIAVLCVMDAVIKELGTRYPTFQLVFLRFLFGAAWSAFAVVMTRPGWPSRETIHINMLRGTIGVFTATSFFYSLQTLPLAEAVAFSFLSPLFLVLFGALILREAVTGTTLIGLLFGFVGMLVMAFGEQSAGPGTGRHLPGVAAAVASAVSYAFGLVLLRQRARTDALAIIVLFQTLVPALLLVIPALAVWQPLREADLALFAAAGLLGLAGHLLLAYAFRHSEAARLAPTEYTALIFAGALGALLFGEIPGIATYFGSALIIAGTLAAMQRRTGQREPPAEPGP